MGSPISRRPAGLLDLLLTQQQGQNPNDLQSTLQPILNLGPFYESERLEVESQGVGFTAVGNSTALAVPAGEVWKLNFLSADWTFATANQELGLVLQLYPGGSQIDVYSPGVIAAPAAASESSISFSAPQPLVLPSGTLVRVRVEHIDLDGEANIAVTLRSCHVRMDT